MGCFRRMSIHENHQMVDIGQDSKISDHMVLLWG